MWIRGTAHTMNVGIKTSFIKNFNIILLSVGELIALFEKFLFLYYTVQCLAIRANVVSRPYKVFYRVTDFFILTKHDVAMIKLIKESIVRGKLKIISILPRMILCR